MSSFGGATKFGGGAVFGGGRSVYEEWREKLLEYLGRNGLDVTDGTNSWKLFSAWGAGFEGAHVDAERLYTEGTPSCAVESLHEWCDRFGLERRNCNDDALRTALYYLQRARGTWATSTEYQNMAQDILAATGSGMTTTCTVHTTTQADCAAVNNAGDGVRYIAILAPEWCWREEYRDYYFLIKDVANKICPHGREVAVAITSSGGEPAFQFNYSIVNRDAVHDTI